MSRKSLMYISNRLLTHSHKFGCSPHKHWVVWLTTKPKVAGSTPAFRANTLYCCSTAQYLSRLQVCLCAPIRLGVYSWMDRLRGERKLRKTLILPIWSIDRRSIPLSQFLLFTHLCNRLAIGLPRSPCWDPRSRGMAPPFAMRRTWSQRDDFTSITLPCNRHQGCPSPSAPWSAFLAG